MPQLVWFVTGTTSGIGAALVLEIVRRGDKVIATGRNAEKRIANIQSDSIAVLDLDLEAGKESIEGQVKKAVAIWGRIDVLFNNAGMSDARCLEEASEAYLLKQFQVNVFGNIQVTQAVLPYMRARGSGSIAFTGSGMAWGRLPFLGVYGMSKAALSNFAEALEIEVRKLGISTIVFELGGFKTQLGMPRPGEESGFMARPRVPAYGELYDKVIGSMMNDPEGSAPGSLEKLVPLLVDTIRGEGFAEGKTVPVRVVFGVDAWATVAQKCEEQLKICQSWKEISVSVNRPGQEPNPRLINASSILPENYPF